MTPTEIEAADEVIRIYGHVLLGRAQAEQFIAVALPAKIEPDRDRPNLLRLSRPALTLP